MLMGELAALGGAFLWAVASVIYTRVGRAVGPAEMNLLKNVVALAMLGLTLLFVGQALPDAAGPAVALLLLSGVVGIGLGDTAYFETLNAVGPRRALLLETLAPPLAALLALVFLGERLHPGAWLGIAVTVVGVTWVITERAPQAGSGTAREAVAVAGGRLRRGLLFGLLAALAQAGGAVLSRAAFLEADVSSLWSAFLRLAAGAVVLGPWLALTRCRVGGWLRQPGAAALGGRLLAAITLGTYLALWLQQVSLKLTLAGVAQTLFATSPLFVLPFAAWQGERISLRAALGAGLALGGVALLFAF
ncbi:MAG: DMT family transporter [Anaerolineae bacterium]|nr:DMT family transporter [Anaerolineae bacterium]